MAATTTFSKETLEVPGATLYYEVRGSGPVLLMMPGGPADATTFRQVENDLARKYTVVTYDPRTYSRSKVHEPVDDARMVEIFADDAHRLLQKVAGDQKSCIFASSGGATIALDLIARHPEQIATVVCHEPPSPSLLTNKEETRAAFDDVCDTCEKEGLFPAMQKFLVLVGVQAPPPSAPDHEPTAEEKEQQALMMGNMNYFFGRYIRNIGRFEPDLEAVANAKCRVIGAIGEESDDGQLARRGGKKLAEIVGGKPVVFPGDHAGFDGKPKQFAARLIEVLEG
ncbi:MAG TPA: alpha/beta hydrolase [Candidatus Dormibacteraeota bacterium]|nr:alpha/beta hydrolase [Candidatus Dormibacteraeota bacterium]